MKLVNALSVLATLVLSYKSIASPQIQAVTAEPVAASKVVTAKVPQQYIIELSNRSELAVKAQLAQTQRTSALSQTLTQQRLAIKQQQSSLMSKVKNLHPDAKVKRSYSKVANALAIETSLTAKQLSQLDGVAGVYPVRRYSTKLNSALPIIKASDAWQLVGGQEQAGRGVRIAVIDSGIVPNHPLFSGQGFTAPPASSLPNNDYCRTSDASFCNNKLIVARYYKPSFVDASYGEFDSPLGLSGHGTHVAGIATGRQVNAPSGESISGVAPGAYLMVYKALWGQDGEGSDVNLVAALEDAVSDGADIINNSWGGNNGVDPINTLYNNVFRRIEQSGIVLVTAAGNEGQDDQGNTVVKSIACPGCVEAGITVGATTTGLINGVQVSYGNINVFGQASDRYSPSSAITATLARPAANNTLGCNAWAANISGKIALVDRGTCTFETKANLAAQAGAVGLLVVNNTVGANITMSMGSATLPALMVTMSDGNRLASQLQQTPNANATMSASAVLANDPQAQDRIARFSSLGPNGDDSFIKPDLSAPGVAILSGTATTDNDTANLDYARLSGTSMATPMVAGSAAILKQAKPNYSALEIKNILVNSVDAVVRTADGTAKATAFETGAGRLNLIKAMNSNTYATKPNMAANACGRTCELSNSLNLIGNQAQTWTSSIEFDQARVSAVVSPAQLSLSSSAAKQAFSVVITVPNGLEQKWHFGRLTWTNQNGDTLHQAIAFNNVNQTSALLQAQVTDKDSNSKTLSLTSQNISNNERLQVKMALTGAGEFDTDSLRTNAPNPVTITSRSAQLIEFESQVPTGSASIRSDAAPVTVDLSTSNLQPLVCDVAGNEDGCDEVLFRLSFNFSHFGQSYQQLYLSDNGIVVAGELGGQARYSANQQMPSTTAPNNIIAPFWTDFDLANPNLANDTGGGQFYVGEVEVGSERYLVIQWHKAKLWFDESQGIDLNYWGVSSKDLEFTFQLILQQNSDNKWFRYLSIPEQPNIYSVGVEDAAGTAGSSYWHNGSGQSQVTSNDVLTLNSGAIGQLTASVDMLRKVNTEFSQDDQVSTQEDSPVTVNLLTNDAASSGQAFVDVSVGSANFTEQVFSDNANVELNTGSVTIVNAPSNGQVQVLDNGLVRYTPSANFFGNDSFRYSVANTAGQTSSSAVNINVQAVNDIPVITNLSLPTEVNAGQAVNASVTASDIDTANLTYQWQLPSELTSSNLTGSSIRLQASSSLTADKSVSVAVTVSDGTSSISRSASILLKAQQQSGNNGSDSNGNSTPATSGESSSGGGVGFYYLLALLVLMAQRFRFNRSH